MKKDLKAYVRYDGQGKIVPSSVILARSKPKVGKWVEGPAYLCCNFTTTTTTTVCMATYELLLGGPSDTANEACASFGGDSSPCYADTNNLSIATVLYNLSRCTSPGNGYYSDGTNVRQCINGVLGSVEHCTTTTTSTTSSTTTHTTTSTTTTATPTTTTTTTHPATTTTTTTS